MMCICSHPMDSLAIGKRFSRWFKCSSCTLYGRDDIKGGRTYWSFPPSVKLSVPPGCLILIGMEFPL